MEENNKEQQEQAENPNDFSDFRDSAEDLIKAMADTGASLFNLARNRFEFAINEVRTRVDGDTTSDAEIVDDENEDGDSKDPATIIENLKEEADKARENFEDKFKDITTNLRQRFDYISRSDYDDLLNRIAELEKMVGIKKEDEADKSEEA